MEERLYLIVGARELGIITGVQGDLQILAQVGPQGSLLVKFSHSGDLQEVVRTPFSSPSQHHDEEQRLAVELQPIDLIRVKRFYLDSDHVGIRDYPRALEEHVRNPGRFSGALKEQLDIDLELWQGQEDFVLEWAGGEYYLDGRGFVTST